MTVLYDHQIFSSQPQGGVSRYFAELVRGAEAAGFRALAGWQFTANRYLREQDRQWMDWAPNLQFRGKAHLTGVWNRRVSRRALSGRNWDIFHPTYYDPYFLRHLDGRPFVLTIHDMTHELHPGGLSDRRIIPDRKRLLAAKATRIITVSENTRQDVIRILGVNPDLVVAIPHGNSLRPGLVEPVLPGCEPGYWLYVGSRAEYKNWSLVVRALSLRNRPEDRLIMVGGGPLSDQEKAILERVGLGPRARQVSGSDAELAGWYSSAKALLYPSRYEGFGMPLLEAMAWGCPVVAARASSLPEVGGSAVLYFDPNSEAELVSALGRIDDPEACTGLISAGRTRESLFRWERSVELTARVYRECL